jgi:hypothetical protein
MLESDVMFNLFVEDYMRAHHIYNCYFQRIPIAKLDSDWARLIGG